MMTLKKKWGFWIGAAFSAVAMVALFTFGSFLLDPIYEGILGVFVDEGWANENVSIMIVIVLTIPAAISVACAVIIVMLRNRFTLPRANTKRAKINSEVTGESNRGEIIANILAFAAMLWMIFEALGIGNMFGYQGLSNDDIEARGLSDSIEAFFDPVGLVITTMLLAASIVIHVLARTTTTKVTMIISIVFYVLAFFRVSFFFSMLFAAVGATSAQMENPSDTRTPNAEELVIEAPRIAHYHNTNGTRVTTAFTNATSEHWESANATVTLQGADGDVCMRVEIEEEWLAPGERREVVTKFFDPPRYYSSNSCAPANATATATLIDVDSRSEIPDSDYMGGNPVPAFTSLSPVEVTSNLMSRVSVHVAGVLAPESTELLRSDRSLPAGFEVADAQGVRLEWCFKPGDVAEGGSFSTRKYHSPLDPGIYMTVIPVPFC